MDEVTPITTRQALTRFEQEPVNGIIDLTNLDLRNVELYLPEVRQTFADLMRRAMEDETQPFYIDMSGSDISGLPLNNMFFHHVILNNVKAERTIFTNSDFTDVKFENANVDYADFRNAILYFTSMYNTSIIGANFTGADLTYAKGLKLENPGAETIERLGVCRYINYAKLPPNAEYLREKIQERISYNFMRKNSKVLAVLEKAAAPEAEYASTEW